MRDVERVLVDDNDEGFRTLAASGLAEYDYSTTIAENAEEALDYLESGAPCDVVLTDVVMSGIGGVELRRRAQIMRPGLLPVVLMSGRPDALATAGRPVRITEALYAFSDAVRDRCGHRPKECFTTHFIGRQP